jgi:hypothetical protein
MQSLPFRFSSQKFIRISWLILCVLSSYEWVGVGLDACHHENTMCIYLECSKKKTNRNQLPHSTCIKQVWPSRNHVTKTSSLLMALEWVVPQRTIYCPQVYVHSSCQAEKKQSNKYFQERICLQPDHIPDHHVRPWLDTYIGSLVASRTIHNFLALWR